MPSVLGTWASLEGASGEQVVAARAARAATRTASRAASPQANDRTLSSPPRRPARRRLQLARASDGASPRHSPRGSPLLKGTSSWSSASLGVGLGERTALEQLVSRARSPPPRDAALGGADGAETAVPPLDAALNEVGTSGWTPLHRAVKLGDADLVAGLLEAGASHSKRTQYGGETPLHVAAQKDNPSVVKQLLEAQADPNARTTVKQWTPLHFAAQHQFCAEVAELLLKAGGDPNAEGQRGVTPAHLARRSRNAALVAWAGPPPRTASASPSPLPSGRRTSSRFAQEPAVGHALEQPSSTAAGEKLASQDLALRLELSALKTSELQKRARLAGVDEAALDGALDSERPRESIMELLLEAKAKQEEEEAAAAAAEKVKAEEAAAAAAAKAKQEEAEAAAAAAEKRLEFSALKTSELQKRARLAGIDETALDGALDSERPRESIMELLLEADSQATAKAQAQREAAIGMALELEGMLGDSGKQAILAAREQ